jgi:hypothetical protein
VGKVNAKLKESVVTRARKTIRRIQVLIAMLFGDIFGHGAWNDTDGRRVVLFMDVLRPLPYLAGLLKNRTIIKAIAASPFIRGATENHQAWERRMSLWN